MQYVVSLMEDTGSREDWQPVVSIVLDSQTPLDTPEATRAFDDSVMTQLRALGVIHDAGDYYLWVTDVAATVHNAAGAAVSIYQALADGNLLPEGPPPVYDMSGDPFNRNPFKGPGTGGKNYQQWLKDVGVLPKDK